MKSTVVERGVLKLNAFTVVRWEAHLLIKYYAMVSLFSTCTVHIPDQTESIISFSALLCLIGRKVALFIELCCPLQYIWWSVVERKIRRVEYSTVDWILNFSVSFRMAGYHCRFNKGPFTQYGRKIKVFFRFWLSGYLLYVLYAYWIVLIVTLVQMGTKSNLH